MSIELAIYLFGLADGIRDFLGGMMFVMGLITAGVGIVTVVTAGDRDYAHWFTRKTGVWVVWALLFVFIGLVKVAIPTSKTIGVMYAAHILTQSSSELDRTVPPDSLAGKSARVVNRFLDTTFDSLAQSEKKSN